MQSLNLFHLLSFVALLIPLTVSAPVAGIPICRQLAISNVPADVQQGADGTWSNCGEGSQVVVTPPAAGQQLPTGPSCKPLTFQGQVVHVVVGADGGWSNCGGGFHLQVVASRETPTALDEPTTPIY